MSKALKGKKLLITREEKQAQPLVELVQHAGAEPFLAPLLQFQPIYSKNNEQALKKIQEQVDWLFFTSANTVYFFEAYRKQLGLTFSQKIAAVGVKTSHALMEYGYTVHFQPSIYSGAVMVPEFINKFGKEQKIALIGGESARDEIPDLLQKNHVSFQQVAIYRTMKNDAGRKKLRYALKQEMDACLFTSPSTVKTFIEFADAYYLEKTKKETLAVAIGLTTATELKKQGFQHVIYPQKYTIEAMVEQLVAYLQNERTKKE